MKITVMNFGPIENASIDFSKNITAIYGENNIGKSYYLQVAYLVIKYILKNTSSIRENYHERRFWYHYDLSTNTKTKLKEIVNSSSDANITDIVKEELIYKINQYFFIPFIKALENTFQNFNSNLKKNANLLLSTR
jgi:predicted ATP-dependent endonuclease of OLD family